MRRAPFDTSFVLNEDWLNQTDKQELRVVAYDNLGNTGEDFVQFEVR